MKIHLVETMDEVLKLVLTRELPEKAPGPVRLDRKADEAEAGAETSDRPGRAGEGTVPAH